MAAPLHAPRQPQRHSFVGEARVGREERREVGEMGDRRSVGGRGGRGGRGGASGRNGEERNGAPQRRSTGGSFPSRGGGGGEDFGEGRWGGGGGGGGGGGYRSGGLKRMPNLEDIEATKKKFTGRCRLFVGNMPGDMKEEELKELFADFGEVAECFMSGKGFAFIRLDTRAHAEAAKETLDGKNIRNRSLRVRFAVHGAALRVKELSPYVSNELLFQAFSQFGEVERAVHIVDEKGRPVGEGIVEFARKGGALETLRRVGEGVFLLTGDPRPVTVEALEPRDEEDGLSERLVQKNSQYAREREQMPRFPPPGSFEADYGQRWKELYAMEKARRQELDQSFLEARQRLEGEMDLAFQDYQTAQLREDLRRRQEELDRLEATKRERMDMFGPGRGNSFGGMAQQGLPMAMGGQGMGQSMGGQGMGGQGMGGMTAAAMMGGGGGDMGMKPFGAPPELGGGAFGAMGGGRDGGVNELVKMFKEGGEDGGFGGMGGGMGMGQTMGMGGGMGQELGSFAQDEMLFARNGPGNDYGMPKRRRH